ncbi:ribulose-phosphate 3-epimerase [Candidatus Woesearchaeota archaeon]|nr:ribulose-phosphate 3-epimerase [Candidatus Woesearchaeota archaeon]
MVKVSASLWSADLTDLGDEIKKIEKYVDYFHFDVGDGLYVHSLLFFPDLIRALKQKTKLPFEIHLMVNNPDNFLKLFEDCSDLIAFHPESTNSAINLIKKIKRLGLKAGIVINTNESIEHFEDILTKVDKVTLMGTKIGVKGEEFDKNVYNKIKNLRKFYDQRNIKIIEIEVDGGIRPYTVEKIVNAGADTIVAGSILFNKKYKLASKWLHKLE